MVTGVGDQSSPDRGHSWRNHSNSGGCHHSHSTGPLTSDALAEKSRYQWRRWFLFLRRGSVLIIDVNGHRYTQGSSQPAYDGLKQPTNAPMTKQEFMDLPMRQRKHCLIPLKMQKYFEGWRPIEVMAGKHEPRLQPMKPVGFRISRWLPRTLIINHMWCKAGG